MVKPRLLRSPEAPAGLVVLGLDLAGTGFWSRRQPEYRSYQQELIAMLAAGLQVDPSLIETRVYPALAEVTIGLTAAGNLNFPDFQESPVGAVPLFRLPTSVKN